MNFILPPITPRILTEQIFINNGMFTGSATQYQINGAFCVAEGWIEQEIGTFLVDTTFTGTYVFGSDPILKTVGMIKNISSVTLIEKFSNNVERFISGTAHIKDPYSGYFTVTRSDEDISSCNGCGGQTLGIYKAEIVVTAGYPTGRFASDPNMILALCLAADIALPIFMDRGMSQEYEVFEKTLQIGRTIVTKSDKHVFNTAMGTSARAQLIRNLVRAYKIERAGGLGK